MSLLLSKYSGHYEIHRFGIGGDPVQLVCAHGTVVEDDLYGPAVETLPPPGKVIRSDRYPSRF